MRKTDPLVAHTVAAALVAIAAAIAVSAGPTCLPGQQPCVNTCCDTAGNYTCCPYNGGYCAPPGDQCCEQSTSGGTCPKTSSCCLLGQCCDDRPSNKTTCCFNTCAYEQEECCAFAVCPKEGQCCKGNMNHLEDYFCRSASDHCCLGGGNVTGNDQKLEVRPSAFACPPGESCCSVLTSRKCHQGSSPLPDGTAQDAINSCCGAGTVCCPSAPWWPNNDNAMRLPQSPRTPQSTQSFSSSACAYALGDGNPFAEPYLDGLVKPEPYTTAPKLAADTKDVTPCADPAKDFCCGGMACPTETLCCSGDGTTYADGCCFGVPSKDNSCLDPYLNATCPSPDDVRY